MSVVNLINFTRVALASSGAVFYRDTKTIPVLMGLTRPAQLGVPARLTLMPDDKDLLARVKGGKA